MLTSLVSLQQENVKKSKKSMKIINIVGENFHIFWMTWGFSMKSWGKIWLMITLRFTKIGFHSVSRKDTFINSQEQFKLTAPFIRFIFKLPVDRKEERGRRKNLNAFTANVPVAESGGVFHSFLMQIDY